jgi:hypothetical protein
VQEPAGPPPFQGVRSVALVRSRDAEAGRPRDPLDALKESLAARGLEVRTVELGPRVDGALRPVQRLQDRAAREAEASGSGRERVRRLGEDAAAAVRGLGVDAVVLYHRTDDWRLSAAPDPRAFASPGLPPAVARRPVAALTAVDANGAAVTYAWGAPGDGLGADPTAPVNAAEAVDLVVRALAGGGGEDL